MQAVKMNVISEGPYFVWQTAWVTVLLCHAEASADALLRHSEQACNTVILSV